jgi:ribosome maturation factor RimP
MNIESQIRAVEQKVLALISADPEAFLVDVKIRPGNNVKVFIDADRGVSIDKLSQYNRILCRQIDESGLFPNGDFSLEISSPGLDEPLKLYRQYLKNIGRHVEVLLKNGIKYEGKLVSATQEEIVIEEEKISKKIKEVVPHTISYNDVKTTKIQIRF